MKRRFFAFLSLLLIMAMLLPTLASCVNPFYKNPNDNPTPTPSPSGDEEDEDEDIVHDEDYYFRFVNEESERDAIVDFSNAAFKANNYSAKAKITDAVKFDCDDYSESVSYHFTGKDSSPQFTISPRYNLSNYNMISFSVYSEKATGAKLQLRLIFEGTGNGNTKPYIRVLLPVNFTGWKTFTYTIDDLSKNYNPDLTKLMTIQIDKSGWDLACSNDTSIYLGNVYALQATKEMKSEVALTSSVFTGIKDRWRSMYIGDVTLNAAHTEEYNSRVKGISSDCGTAWTKYKTAGGKNFGYSITNGKTGDESKIADIYINLRDMARGYATVGSTYYHNANLLKDIKECLEYTYNNYYSLTTVKNQYGNWWYWDIGIPMRMTVVLLIMEDELGKETVAKYLAPFDYLNMYPSETAANKVWIAGSCLLSALLQEDGERILRCKEEMNDVFDYVLSGDGFYRDGSFVQHSAFAYSGGYGLSMIDSLSEILYAFNDSRFDFTEQNVHNHYDWVMNSYVPLVYGGRLFASVRGREVSRNTSETSAGYTFISTLARMIGYAPKAYREQYKSLLRSYMIAQETDFVGKAGIDLCMVEECEELYKNNDVKVTDLAEGVTVFGNMDRVTYQSDDYAACVAMSSSRIYKYECINNENKKGWFQGDGMIYIYTKNYDFDYNYFNYVDPYFLPGITRTSQTRTEESLSTGNSLKGGSAFVGGLEAGKYGMAVLDLSYANTSYSKIKAKKTYFFFDNEIVCIGSGISDSSGTDLVTVIESRKKYSSDTFTVGGEVVTLGNTSKSYTNKWAHFTGMGGYCFFQNTTFYAKMQNNVTSFFQMWLNHGKNLSNGKYSYVYLPTLTAEETKAYASDMDVQILTHSDTIHVVHESSLGATAYAFYAYGTADGVNVSRACCVFITEGDDGKTVISVSDPSFKTDKLTVKIDMAEEPEVVSSDSNITATYSAGSLNLSINMSGNVGGTSTITVK